MTIAISSSLCPPEVSSDRTIFSTGSEPGNSVSCGSVTLVWTELALFSCVSSVLYCTSAPPAFPLIYSHWPVLSFLLHAPVSLSLLLTQMLPVFHLFMV